MFPGDCFTVYRNGEFLSLGVIEEDNGVLMTCHPDEPSEAVIESLMNAIREASSWEDTTIVLDQEVYLIERREPTNAPQPSLMSSS